MKRSRFCAFGMAADLSVGALGWLLVAGAGGDAAVARGGFGIAGRASS